MTAPAPFVIQTGPTFRFGVVGTVLIFLAVLFGIVSEITWLLLLLPGISLLLSWKRLVLQSQEAELTTTTYFLLLPVVTSESIKDYNQVVIVYQWEPNNDSNSVLKRTLTNSDMYEPSRYFDVQLMNTSGEHIVLANFAAHRQAQQLARKLADALCFALCDEYAEIQQRSIKRRQSRGDR